MDIFMGNDLQGIENSIEQGNLPNQIALIKRFEFSSKLQRMSVIVKKLNEQIFRLHVKGSPEKIYELCRKETLPSNIKETLEFYAKQGYRVLAFAMRILPLNYRRIQKIDRD